MDRLDHYRQSIRKFLDKYVDMWQEKDVETQLVIDSERLLFWVFSIPANAS